MAHYIFTFDSNSFFKHLCKNLNFNLHLINYLNLRSFSFMNTNLNNSIHFTLSGLSLPK
ncbi:Uncharacterized protein YP598_0123 [Yersinia pseudotuberculosis]|uniref:Uncharacterized protein n=1 Tax=Yersinia pseudotuberculosis serotype O:1b (strain IP 31758) TaxID=349747 RepID=A0A0U1R3F5_YERP3|nr:hypothetical protein YpsIP31758_4039 [Yersinia pseudotuberculosis IP 31758]UFA59751.1 Uncharacterized protein YP598_0123 [Yersinia pseudotuberculosis]